MVVFQKQYNPPGNAMEPFCMARDRSGGYLLTGNYYLPSANNFVTRTTSLVHINEKGCIDWARSMTEGQEEVIQSILSTADSGFLVSAFPYQSPQDNYPTELIVFKLDKSGNKEWAHSFSNGINVTNFFSALCETSDGGFALEIGSYPLSYNPSFFSIIKIDHSGQMVWGRKLGMENNAVYNIGGILEKNNFLYATGSIYENTAPFDILRSFLVQIDNSTGQLIWTRQNDPALDPLTFTDIHNYKDSLLINSYSQNLQNDFIFIDQDGNFGSSVVVNNPYGSLNGKENILVTPDNGIYFHQSSGISGLSHKDIIMRLDSNKQIVWQYDFSIPELKSLGWYQLSSAPDNGVADIGSGLMPNGFKALTFLKMDSLGKGCHAGMSALQLTANQVSILPMGWVINSDLSLTVQDVPMNLKDMPVDSRMVCPGNINGCDSLKLEGPGKVCRPGDTAKYILHHDSLCADAVTWTYDPQFIKVISAGQSYMEVSFTKAGDFIIKVDKNDCTTMEDSMTISVGNVKPPPGSFLPPDTVICSGEILDLKPLQSFGTYSWSTGETGNALKITDPGRYTLQVTDSFGCAGSDTIKVETRICPPGIFFSNAFTPNHDGHNDIFKPLLFSRPVQYQLTVYNRWGQFVFESTDPGAGWNGRIGSAEQESGTYIWICTYQFAGGKKSSAHGTVLLLR
ncbi:MAG TPA: gliding motility-associated C-terminal domain-containing protein [Puia sp.]|nr:gliding motility-associated C-terminal domain-containing protein [Puia sp.]